MNVSSYIVFAVTIDQGISVSQEIKLQNNGLCFVFALSVPWLHNPICSPNIRQATLIWTRKRRQNVPHIDNWSITLNKIGKSPPKVSYLYIDEGQIERSAI